MAATATTPATPSLWGRLQGGISIEDVAKLLWHASIEITQKHYAPSVKSRHDLLEREIWRVYEIGTDF
jgi:hypothetical protein